MASFTVCVFHHNKEKTNEEGKTEEGRNRQGFREPLRLLTPLTFSFDFSPPNDQPWTPHSMERFCPGGGELGEFP